MAVARWSKTQNCLWMASLMHPQAINKYLISVLANVSCTMIVGWRLGKVLACSEYQDRFYGSGKTGPNTDSSRKKKESGGGGGGLGWGLKVVRHTPWGALSGFPRVLGHESMFWGCCGGFCAPVFQYIQYRQILIIYLHIHTYTFIYLSNTH
jgi:hypothetical protein